MCVCELLLCAVCIASCFVFFLLGCRIRETGGIISRHAIRPDAQKAMKTHRSSPKNFISSTAPVRQINSQSVADRFFFFLGWNFRINRPRNNNAHGPIAKNGHRYAGFFQVDGLWKNPNNNCA
jgi:hypothetical protein